MKKLLLLGGIVGTILILFLSGAMKYVTLEAIREHRGQLEQLLSIHPLTFPLAFLLIYIVQTALSLPGATVMTFAAGALFGVGAGTTYAVIGATCGAAVAFLLARYLFRNTIERRLGSRFGEVNREMEQSGLNYLLFLRLVPLFPFFMVNLAAALTRIRFDTFLLGTFIGIIPGGFVYANAGATLADVESMGDIISPRVIVAFLMLGLFALVPVIYRKTRKI